MGLARVDVEKERAGVSQQAVRFEEARAEEAEEVVELVGIALIAGRGMVGGEALGTVAAAAEAGTVAGGVLHRAQADAVLLATGVEGGVDVDEGEAGVREGAQDGEIVALEDGACRCHRLVSP